MVHRVALIAEYSGVQVCARDRSQRVRRFFDPRTGYDLARQAVTAVEGEGDMVQWNPDVLDRLIAPGIARFTTAQIPNLKDQFPQSTYWLTNHFLNNALRGNFHEGSRQIAFAFLRRAQDAFRYFHDAGSSTLVYLERNDVHNPRVSAYFKAVSDWEGFCLQAQIAMDLFRWLNAGVGAFQKGDGSKEQRIYSIANEVKHTVGAVDAGRCKPEHTVPLWLTNEGLHSFEFGVSWAEAAEVLSDISKFADAIQDPLTCKEKLQAAVTHQRAVEASTGATTTSPSV